MVVLQSTASPNLQISLGQLHKLKSMDLSKLEESIKSKSQDYDCIALGNMARLDGHALACTLGVPTDRDLLEKYIPKEQLREIYDRIGGEGLLAMVEEASKVRVDFSVPWCNNEPLKEAEKMEGRHLQVVTAAIQAVTKQKPWIIGFAAEFADSLLRINPQSFQRGTAV